MMSIRVAGDTLGLDWQTKKTQIWSLSLPNYGENCTILIVPWMTSFRAYHDINLSRLTSSRVLAWVLNISACGYHCGSCHTAPAFAVQYNNLNSSKICGIHAMLLFAPLLSNSKTKTYRDIDKRHRSRAGHPRLLPSQ